MTGARSDNPVWVQWYPSNSLSGCLPLTGVEELAYRRILDMIFVSDDHLRDDDRTMPNATKAGRQWRAVKARLIELGKITVEDGFIRNARATQTCDNTRRYRAAKAVAGTASHAPGKRLKTRETTPAAAPQQQVPVNNQQQQEDSPSLRSGAAATATADQRVEVVRQDAKVEVVGIAGVTDAPPVPPLPPGPPGADLLGHVPRPSARQTLYGEGMAKLVQMTGRTPDRLRGWLGKVMQHAQDDAALVLGLVQDAHRKWLKQDEEVADPVAWITGCVKARIEQNDRGRVVPFPAERPKAAEAAKPGSGAWIAQQKEAAKARAAAAAGGGSPMPDAAGPTIDGHAERVG